jgi:hypothetical protein
MVLLDSTVLYRSLEMLDESLRLCGSGKKWHLVCCGGAAMLALGIEGRRTNDVDLVLPSMSEELKAAARVVHQRLGLNHDWLNDGPSELVSVLPSDWLLLVEPVYPRVFCPESVLSVSRLGRRDLILTKFLAHVDRGTARESADLADLLALAPTAQEIKWAAEQIRDYDTHPGWNKFVEKVMFSVVGRLGHGL